MKILLKSLNWRGIPSLTLQNLNSADPMEPALKDVEPFGHERVCSVQKAQGFDGAGARLSSTWALTIRS